MRSDRHVARVPRTVHRGPRAPDHGPFLLFLLFLLLGGRPHARVREERAHASPEGGGRHPQSKKFVADVGASIPTGTSRIIDEKVRDVVIPVNALDPLYREYTSEQLRAKTDEFRARLKKGDTLDDLRVEAFAVVREAARRELNMRHFDVQIVGGALLHEGSICEMATGEGKTLTATLPAYLNALSGKGVHVVTVNDYLARRDAPSGWVACTARWV